MLCEEKKNKYAEKNNLLLTDTDSLCYLIELKNLDEYRLQEIDRYDNSKYPKNRMS